MDTTHPRIVSSRLPAMPRDVAAATIRWLGLARSLRRFHLVFETEEATIAKMPALPISPAALKALDEYSETLPTGLRTGRRWRRNVHAGLVTLVEVCGLWFVLPLAPLWIVGEYGEPDADGAPITWWRPEIRG